MFSADLEVLQNCTGFTLCSSEDPAVGKFSAVMDFTSCLLCVHINCVLSVLDYYYLLISQLCLQDWVGLCSVCVLSTPEGLATSEKE